MKNNSCTSEILIQSKQTNKISNKIFTIKKINKDLILTSSYLQKFLPKFYFKISNDQNILNINSNCKIELSDEFESFKSFNDYAKNRELDKIVADFDLDILIDELILSQKRCLSFTTSNSFNKNYTLFKKTLFFQNLTRKTKIDSVLKKCKAKFIKALQDVLSKLLKDFSIFYRLPRNFVSDINIDSNKKYLNLPMTQIYKSFDMKINLADIKTVLTDKGIDLFNSIMRKSYKNLYEEYIRSKRFKYDCIRICRKEGKKFELLFKYVSKIFIDYYSFSKGNKLKKVGKTNNSSDL